VTLHPETAARAEDAHGRLAVVREVEWSTDTTTVGDIVHAYLTQTEHEKREHGDTEPSSPGSLPERYRQETADPRAAYADCTVLIAEVGQRPAGVVIVRDNGGEAEIKRLWAAPEARGLGVGSALLDAAVSLTPTRPVRLSVWEWRNAAIRLYESRGFRRVTSWEDRPALVCMVRAAGAR
jgi:ribosomal protein S18 acetylase RimI-like enzyme